MPIRLPIPIPIPTIAHTHTPYLYPYPYPYPHPYPYPYPYPCPYPYPDSYPYQLYPYTLTHPHTHTHGHTHTHAHRLPQHPFQLSCTSFGNHGLPKSLSMSRHITHPALGMQLYTDMRSLLGKTVIHRHAALPPSLPSAIPQRASMISSHVCCSCLCLFSLTSNCLRILFGLVLRI